MGRLWFYRYALFDPQGTRHAGTRSDAFLAVPVTERFEINLASLEKAIVRRSKAWNEAYRCGRQRRYCRYPAPSIPWMHWRILPVRRSFRFTLDSAICATAGPF